MNELALFAGAGGGILGGYLMGWRTVCAVEIEDYPRRVLLARQRDGILPPFPIWDDIKTFDGYPWRRRVDVVSGGFPCQDISCAVPNGEGIDGERSGLWSHFARIIGEVQPSLVFVENSPMLTVRGLERVLGDLASLGYDARWGVLGGSWIGNVCEGERLWIVAYPADGSVLESVEFPADIKPCSAGSCRWQYSRASGAMLGQDDYSRIKRDPYEVATQMDRLKAIGNGQISGVARLAFQTLKGCMVPAPAPAGRQRIRGGTR